MDNRRQIDQNLIDHQLAEEKRLLEIEQTIKSLESKLDILQTDVSSLVSAWKAAGWLVGVVKWVGGIAVALTAISVLLKGIR